MFKIESCTKQRSKTINCPKKGVWSDSHRTAQPFQMVERKSLETTFGMILKRLQPKQSQMRSDVWKPCRDMHCLNQMARLRQIAEQQPLLREEIMVVCQRPARPWSLSICLSRCSGPGWNHLSCQWTPQSPGNILQSQAPQPARPVRGMSLRIVTLLGPYFGPF